MSTLLALQEATLWLAVFIAAALFACLLIPYLFEEGWRGKIDLGPRFPIGAGDVHPGYRGNPTPGKPVPQALPHRAMLSLRSFHLVLIALSIALASGTGVWGVFNHEVVLGAMSLGVAIVLIAYGRYFVSQEKNLE